jgi:hypothetical protein
MVPFPSSELERIKFKGGRSNWGATRFFTQVFPDYSDQLLADGGPMNREDHIDNLKKQYADGIFEAYLECEHENGTVDTPELKARLERLSKAAAVEGVHPAEFHELVFGVLPHDIVVSLYPEEFGKPAA